MNGSKRFVVSMSHPTEKGSFASTGVLFNLEDLKEVSELTEDQVKYICNHKVTGRVQIRRVLNPEAWIKGDTYLRVEGTIIDDCAEPDDDDEVEGEGKAMDSGSKFEALKSLASAFGMASTEEEQSLKSSFSRLVNLQHELEEGVRFTRDTVDTLGVSEGVGDGSLWSTVRLWQTYTEQRLVGRKAEIQNDFQERLLEFLKEERGVDVENDLPSAVVFQDLSPELQIEVRDLQSRTEAELGPLELEAALTMQKILEAEDHIGRVNLLRHFMDAERKRLEARRTLQGLFLGKNGLGLAAEDRSPNAVAEVDEDEDDDDEDYEEVRDIPLVAKLRGDQRSIYMDEPDAFQ